MTSHYGRIYHFAADRYSARIWTPDGRDIWHDFGLTPDDAYAAMREAALKLGVPVDLFRHGAGSTPTETLNDLPF